MPRGEVPCRASTHNTRRNARHGAACGQCAGAADPTRDRHDVRIAFAPDDDRGGAAAARRHEVRANCIRPRRRSRQRGAVATHRHNVRANCIRPRRRSRRRGAGECNSPKPACPTAYPAYPAWPLSTNVRHRNTGMERRPARRPRRWGIAGTMPALREISGNVATLMLLLLVTVSSRIGASLSRSHQ